MESPAPQVKQKAMNYNKTNTNNENYSLGIKIKDQNSINISITFENNKTYEDCKLYEDIKKEQPYFEDRTIDEAFDEISELISKDNIEFNKKEEQIPLNIILPSEEKKSLDFVLHTKNEKENLNNSLINNFIKNKDEAPKHNQENMQLKDENLKEGCKDNNTNQINEEKDGKKFGEIEAEEMDEKISFDDNINSFKCQKINKKKSLKKSQAEIIKNNVKEEKINEIILSKDLYGNEKNKIINQILNESKENTSHHINNKNLEDININEKIKEDDKISEKAKIEENNIEIIMNKKQKMNMYKESQSLKTKNNRIIIINNNFYGNSSQRNYQINSINNTKKQPKNNTHHKSKCFYICYNCHCRVYYCEACLTPFFLRCSGNDCKDCLHYCCYNSSCLSNCCNECCRFFCDQCCRSLCKCFCKDCCGAICKSIFVDCCGSICDGFCSFCCEGLCRGVLSSCQIF